MLAASRPRGTTAVAPAIFHRAGGGTAPYDDFSKVMPLFEGLDDDGVLVDIDATLDYLHSEGFADDRVGIVGFCFGGRVTFLVAARRKIGAGVGFYGGGITHNSQGMAGPLASEAGSLQTPWLGLFGDEDAMIPVDGVEDLRVPLGESAGHAPTSSATRTPATASTATHARAITKRRRRTAGTARSNGSPATWPTDRAQRARCRASANNRLTSASLV